MTPVVRKRQIALLLVHRNDLFPSPPGLRLASLPGPAPSGKVPCSCARVRPILVNGTTVKTIVGARSCLVCGGYGFRRHIPGLDLYHEESDMKGRVYDPYTLGADKDDKTRLVEPVRKPERDPDDRDPWDRRHRSFVILDRWLDALRVKDEEAWYYTVCAYTEGRYGFQDGEPRLGVGATRAVRRALRFLEARMPRPIRLPADLQQRFEMDERDRRVLHALEGGKSKRQVAREQGVSRRKVNRAVA